jgi:calcineurin-like phosphoesterase family protein
MSRIPKSWLITDTHFNHSMLIENGYRPGDYQEQITRNWKKLVMAEDTVYHLGDVILGRNSDLAAILADLPGRKILIRGNHDRESDGWYERVGFLFVAQALLIGGIYMTHAPQVTLPDGAVINVHGHLHAGTHRNSPNADWCKLLALEVDGYSPVDMIGFVGFSPIRRKILMPYDQPVEELA